MKRSSKTPVLLLSSLLSLAPEAQRVARAEGGWRGTFPAEAVASHLGADRIAVQVCGPAAEPDAVSALMDALRASPNVHPVTGGAELCTVDQLSDRAVVQGAVVQPVDLIAALRVFPGDAGGKTAVVTFYDKRGAVRAALSAELGTPLAPRAAPPASGLPSAAADAVSRVLHDEQPLEKAQQEYEENFVSFDYSLGWAGVSSSDRAYVGKLRRPLEGRVAFFEAVGRQDLAEQHRDGTRRMAALMVPGAILLGLGFTSVIGGLADGAARGAHCGPNGTFSVRPCFSGTDYALMGAGAGGLVLGAALMIAGRVVARRPNLDPAEMQQLADEHNRRLRKRLGLTIAPALGRPGAGVEVRLAF